jgi:hypothetical protein
MVRRLTPTRRVSEAISLNPSLTAGPVRDNKFN